MKPGFTGSTIDRADHLRLDEARIAELAASLGARLLRLAELDPHLDEAGRLAWGSLADLEAEAELIFLGLDGEAPLFAPLRRMRGSGPKSLERVPAAGDDESRRGGPVGDGAQPDRMAQPPSILRRLRHRHVAVPRRLGPEMPAIAGPSISRGSTRS